MVAEIAFQSSSEIRTAFQLFPVMTTGSCVSAASSINQYSFDLASVAFSIFTIAPPTPYVRHHDRSVNAYFNVDFMARAVCGTLFSVWSNVVSYCLFEIESIV